jgi:hypothetical protein
VAIQSLLKAAFCRAVQVELLVITRYKRDPVFRVSGTSYISAGVGGDYLGNGRFCFAHDVGYVSCA